MRSPRARSRTTRPVAVALAALVAVTLAGCGSSASPSSSASTPGGRLPGASPADSPALRTKPAGTVEKVAAAPQGIAYDATTDTLAVAVHDPYRLLLLDPTTLATRKSVSLPGKARHLRMAQPGGPVLVPDETSDELIQVSLPDGRTTATKVLMHPHDALLDAAGDLVVTDEFSHAFSVVHDGELAGSTKDFQRPGGINNVGNLLSAVDVEGFTLSTYDLTTLRRTARVRAGQGPTHAALTTGDREVVVDTRGGALLLFSLDPLKQLGSIRVGGTPYGIATDPTTGIVWVTLTATNRLVGVDYSGATPRKVADYPTVRQPDTVAVAPGSHTLWVTGTDDGEVQRITR